MTKIKKSETYSSVRKKELTFYFILMIIPFVQFCIFYVYVNFNSFLLAFERYDPESASYFWVGLANIKDQIAEFQSKGLLYKATMSSLKVYLWSLCLLPLELLFPYYIYKKLPLGSLFKIVLFLPHVLSTLVLALLYKYFMNSVLPTAMENFGVEIPILLYGDTALITAWLFHAFFGYTSILMYLGTMTSIPESLVEYAKIEGSSLFQEFRYITFPTILPTLIIYLINGLAAVFSNQLNLYAFFSNDTSHAVTVGYLIFARTTGTGMAGYPVPAATGFIFTVIVTPIIVILRLIAKRFIEVA